MNDRDTILGKARSQLWLQVRSKILTPNKPAVLIRRNQ